MTWKPWAPWLSPTCLPQHTIRSQSPAVPYFIALTREAPNNLSWSILVYNLTDILLPDLTPPFPLLLTSSQDLVPLTPYFLLTDMHPCDISPNGQRGQRGCFPPASARTTLQEHQQQTIQPAGLPAALTSANSLLGVHHQSPYPYLVCRVVLIQPPFFSRFSP